MRASRDPSKYHAAVWDEPLITELGRSGRRGLVVPGMAEEGAEPVGTANSLVPKSALRTSSPVLPEMSEFEVFRHYLRLSQQTLGMMGVDLFGTCTMKYNPVMSESLSRLPQVREVHPLQDERTIQGLLDVA